MTQSSRKTQILHLIAFACIFLIESCQSTGQTNSKQMDSEHKHSNSLINETSPYLLQHAHNPVDWHAWNDETLALAKKQDKPLLISIGYSACHWCHVMEHESFEDEEVAKLMNEFFICVKVDREERPDVDQVYMSAVQMITGSGGWPLNCFALPDGRPFHGGTYFRKNQWMSVLKTVNKEFHENRDKLEQFATRLTKGVVQGNIVPLNPQEIKDYKAPLKETVDAWNESFDLKWGGPNREPKFPIPNNYQFLLSYAERTKDKALREYVLLTLDKMAKGGIYDQIGGGFARYSTDKYWKVPHFEKMLYDNAQLLSLYADGYLATKNERYKEVIEETIEFIERELTDKTGAFYSALDADSEGEEGKFYVWSEEELMEIFGDEYALLQDLYILDNFGKWEENFILMSNLPLSEIQEKHHLTEEQLQNKREKIQSKLLQLRSKRVRPGLDDKSLTSWNALCISGLLDAHRATGSKKALDMALRNAKFIGEKQIKEDYSMLHSYKEDRSTINGFIEDYAFVIQAWLDLYEAGQGSDYLKQAAALTEFAIEHFYDEKQAMFRFNSKNDNQLIVNSVEYQDNVMPSSNSVMGHNMYRLYLMTGNSTYYNKTEKMMHNIAPLMSRYGSAFSNWAMLIMNQAFSHYEIVIVGPQAEEVKKKFESHYLPNAMIMASTSDSKEHLFEYRYQEGQTLIYVCQGEMCLAPVDVSKWEDVLGSIR